MKGYAFMGVLDFVAEAPDTALPLHAALQSCRGMPSGNRSVGVCKRAAGSVKGECQAGPSDGFYSRQWPCGASEC